MNRPRISPGRATSLCACSITLLAGSLVSNVAQAGGFALVEQGVSGLGNAYAGGAAVAVDASTAWSNPANMVGMDRQFSGAFHILQVDSTFTDKGTTLFTLDFADGDTTAEPAGVTVLPNLYYVMPVGKASAFGLSISVPFGNSTDYGKDWVGRYQAVESALQVIDINPSFAHQFNERLAIGGGISAQILEATLGSSVDSAAVCIGAYGEENLAPCASVGLTTLGERDNDSYAEISGDSTNVGFNMGARYQMTDTVRFGVHYRHGVEHEVDGDADFDVNPTLAQLLADGSIPLLIDGSASTAIALPSTLSLSLIQEMNDRLTWMADATWTGWSELPELRIQFDNKAQPDSLTVLAWEDTWRISGGVTYRKSDKLTLRAGLAYDEEPISSPKTRTPRIPGNDRFWVSAGLGYQISPAISLDVGFTHIIMDETPIDATAKDAEGNDARGGTTIRGLYDTSVNILGAQLNWSFR